MNDKSHVSLERRVCLVCGTHFDTGSLLLDKRLRQSLERYTTTGWGLCAEQRLRKNPLGIYVNGLSWSRELDASEGAKP